VLKQGIVSKKLSKSLFASKRIFTLTKHPRFFNTTLEGVYKGDLLLTYDLQITLISKTSFQLFYQSTNRKYTMCLLGGKQDAADWVAKLKECQKQVTLEWQH